MNDWYNDLPEESDIPPCAECEARVEREAERGGVIWPKCGYLLKEGSEVNRWPLYYDRMEEEGDVPGFRGMERIAAVMAVLAEWGPMTTREVRDEVGHRMGRNWYISCGSLHAKLRKELERGEYSRLMKAGRKWFISRRVARKLRIALEEMERGV